MRNLLRFILRYNFPILFLIFELIAIILVFSHNPIPRGRLANRVNSASSIIYERTFELTQYMHLRKTNEQLARENSFLRGQVLEPLSDTSFSRNGYEFFSAQVINNSVHKEFNYLTLNKGTNDGVEVDMAVISPFGIVGIVKTVSPNYCRVLSVLNRQFRVSVMLSKSGYFGSLNWDGRKYREVLVTEIPSHVILEPGERIVTSGYSSLFPAGEPVATVIESIPAAGGNFLEVRALLTNDLKQLSTVYIVKNNLKEEIQTLEEDNNEK